jgi:tRNA dimethylallyltransferase
VRALEVFRLTGKPISDHQGQWDKADSARADAQLVTLQWPTEALNRRINARVKQMVEQELLDEVRRIAANPGFGPQACEALGYKQLIPLVTGDKGSTVASLGDAIERIKIDTRRFGKNQRTWLKRLSLIQGCLTIDASAVDSIAIAQTVANTLLTS